MRKIKGIPTRRMDSILSGRLLRLRDGLCKQLRDREWVFNRTEKNLIFLIHQSGAYGVAVKFEDIDWNGCRGQGL